MIGTKEIEQRVKKIIADQLDIGVEKINLYSRMAKDLEADSLEVVELVMEFETAFDLTIPDEDTEKLQTVGDVVDYLEERIN